MSDDVSALIGRIDQLAAVIDRQSRALDALADALGRVVAVNQQIISVLMDDEAADVPAPTYLDGSRL